MPKPKKPLSLLWTLHSRRKMRFYGLSEARVRRVLHAPERVEEGVAEKTIAFMQPVSNGKQEMWVMVQDRGSVRRVISAWRYPGRTKPRSQVALAILRTELDSYAKAAAPVREERKTVAKKKFGRTKWFKKHFQQTPAIDLDG